VRDLAWYDGMTLTITMVVGNKGTTVVTGPHVHGIYLLS
jgi:hypothetical protein